METKELKNLGAEEYGVVLDYLQHLDCSQYKNSIISTVFRLVLLYGFKICIISEMKCGDFDPDRRIIRAFVNNEQIFLDVPFELSQQLANIRGQRKNDDYLFQDENGEKIDRSYFNGALDEVNRLLCSDAKLTFITMSRYAAINMLMVGMNPLTVGDLTGVKSVSLKCCQRIVSERLGQNTNRYLNAKMRNIQAYIDFSKE